MSPKLTAERVREIYTDCLFREGEDTENYVKAEGIMTTVGFHPERLKNHKAEIAELLDELPEEFKKSSQAGGWSFLQAAFDKHGNHWAEHPTMEKLFLLGLAAGKVELQAPREIWPHLPGGMPYYTIL